MIAIIGPLVPVCTFFRFQKFQPDSEILKIELKVSSLCEILKKVFNGAFPLDSFYSQEFTSGACPTARAMSTMKLPTVEND